MNIESQQTETESQNLATCSTRMPIYEPVPAQLLLQ